MKRLRINNFININEGGEIYANVSDCGKVYDESDYGYCPYCSGILDENKSERPFKHCPCCGNTMYWDEFWECTNCDYEIHTDEDDFDGMIEG